jgi:Cdc6-like AAA superfamily ATPase
MRWYKEFGFKKNPFILNPLKSNFEIIGRGLECEEVLYKISAGSMILIEGKVGTGKTTLLKHAINNFKGKGKVVYVNAALLNKKLDIAKLIHKKPKGMILLLDNVNFLSKKNNDKIKYYYDQDRIKSIVFTTTSYKLVNFSDSIKDRIGKDIIKLKGFTQLTTLEIARDRLGSAEFIPDIVLKRIYDEANNLKEFLAICAALGESLVFQEKEVASVYDLKSINGLYENEDYADTEVCERCHEGLDKIDEHWRCRNCDQFCLNCGVLADDEDIYCPGCGAEFEEE